MPTDYSTSKIYKIVCTDGKFYIGSTVLPLNIRFGQHCRAVKSGFNSKVYKHIRLIGGVDEAHIELVVDNLGITTRDELLQIEDTYIREGLRSKLCLNRNKPRATSEERLAREKMQSRMWKKINRDAKLSNSEKTIAERVREYYREHKTLPKTKKNKAELIYCECGWDINRGGLSAHKRTKEHHNELMRWFFMRKILQRSGILRRELPTLWS